MKLPRFFSSTSLRLSPHHLVKRIQADQQVIHVGENLVPRAVRREDAVGAGATVEEIMAEAADQLIVSILPFEPIVAVPAAELVVARAAFQPIVAIAAVQEVIAQAPNQVVVAPFAKELRLPSE